MIFILIFLVSSALFFWTFRGEFGGQMAIETSLIMGVIFTVVVWLVVKAIQFI